MKNHSKAALILAAATCGMASGAVTTFPIGTTWPDTEGVHINCHGGCVVPYEGEFYWFGESRTGGHSDGISVYRSKDLYNWENLGMAAVHQGERDDENLQDISEGRLLERPKVIYNAKTGKWVMWAHWENGTDYGQARVAVLQADRITGPYSFVSTMRPNGHDSRDMTLFLDTDGNAYHFCSTNMNTDINVVRLSEDFLTPTSDETLIMKGRRLEATTVCKVGDMYYSTFSECKGWDPAPGHSASVLGDPLGEWTEGLNFCTDADANRSYRSQGAYVFSVGQLGYDPKCFIFYGDRWNSSNVGGSTYVWLPLSVRSGYPVVRNYDTWNLDEVMKDMYRYKRADAITDGGEYCLLERRSDRLVSRTGRRVGFCIANDNDRTNLIMTFVATADPYIWKLRDAQGLYLTDSNGKLRSGVDGKNAEWRFVLLPDGYYNVINEDTGRCLTVASNSREDGASLTLGVLGENDAQAFCPYFDSYAHPDYKEAAMFTKEYFERVARDIRTQNFNPGDIPGVVSEEFEAGKPFAVILTVAGRALTFGHSGNNNRGIISDFAQSAEQKITFVPAPATASVQGYNITDGNGAYLTKEGDYNTTWASDITLTDPVAIFVPEAVEGQYAIRCVENDKYLGADSTDEGSSVYSDKTGAGRKLSLWHLTDFTKQTAKSDEDLFMEALDEADLLYGSIDPDYIGEDPFDISESAYVAFGQALQKAFDTTSGWLEAKTAIEAATKAFNAGKTVQPDPDKEYYIVSHAGLCVADDGSESPCLVAAEANVAGMKFRAADGGAYMICGAGSGRCLASATGNSWSTAWLDEADGQNRRALWEISFSRLGGKLLRNVNRGACLGFDDAAEGASLFCDKSAEALNSQWRISTTITNGIVPTDADHIIRISTLPGAIVVMADSDMEVEVYSADGVLVRTADSGTDLRLTVPAGIYIVSACTNLSYHSAKVFVK